MKSKLFICMCTNIYLQKNRSHVQKAVLHNITKHKNSEKLALMHIY